MLYRIRNNKISQSDYYSDKNNTLDLCQVTTKYKVMARLVDIDHGETYQKADGYMIAWFMYWLKDDLQARSVFFGDNAEILTNTNWQDVKINY